MTSDQAQTTGLGEPASRTASALETAVRSREGETRLIPYLMAGHPSREASVELGRRYAAAGAAAIEIGIPFSDPLADGPTVQRAGQVALGGGMTVAGAIEVAEAVAQAGVPVVLMTYINPVLAFDVRRFAAAAADAGVSGVIVPDLPVEESAGVAGWLRAAGLDTVFMVAPTSPEPRLAGAAEASSGFVYCVSLTGVTGARAQLDGRLAGLLERVRRHTALPLAAGFGISSPEHVARLRGRADAAVVASALLERVHAGDDPVPMLRAMVEAGSR